MVNFGLHLNVEFSFEESHQTTANIDKPLKLQHNQIFPRA